MKKIVKDITPELRAMIRLKELQFMLVFLVKRIQWFIHLRLKLTITGN